MQVGDKVMVTHNSSRCNGFVGVVESVLPNYCKKGGSGLTRVVVRFTLEGNMGSFVKSFAKRSLKKKLFIVDLSQGDH